MQSRNPAAIEFPLFGGAQDSKSGADVCSATLQQCIAAIHDFGRKKAVRQSKKASGTEHAIRKGDKQPSHP